MAVASSVSTSARPWVPSVLVLGLAAAVRLPHYDLGWFGLDQIYFMAEARRVLSGQWDVVGPLASGLNIVGPLYSYLLGALLWIGGDPGVLPFFNLVCELAAVWLVYDAARRVSGAAAGIAAGVTYAAIPMLVIGTRLIWNPSLLPPLVALGWWLVIRYAERPSTGALLAIAAAAGLTPALHVTGLFHGAAWALVVLVARFPSPLQLLGAIVAGLLPLTPVLPRVFRGSTDAGTLGARLVPNNVLETLAGIGQVTLSFPRGVDSAHWSAVVSSGALHLEAVIALAGLLYGLFSRGTHRAVWLGIAVTFSAYVVGGVLYSGPLSWHYFLALGPPASLCIASAIGATRRLRMAAAVLVALLAVPHLAFVYQFDRRTLEAGFIKIEGVGLAARIPALGSIHSIPFGTLRSIAEVLRPVLPDGATAMMASHGIRAELWRESGAEFMPPARTPHARWANDFILMGPGARPVKSDARLMGERVCVFDKPARTSWRARHGTPPAGWEQPGFADADWNVLGMPVRAAGPSLAGPPTNLFIWRAPQVLLRGRVNVSSPDGKRAFAVSIHSNGASAHWISQFVVNGVELAPGKSRVMYSSLFRNEEWLFDASGRLREGENVIAIAIDGQTPGFDLDVFEVPCLDQEWYR